FWEQRFQELASFKMHHGHCNVPVEYPENPALGIWLNNQRRLQRRRELSPDRIERLGRAGVIWEPQDALWDQRFQELAAFKERFGSCDVPQDHAEDPQLGMWVSNQRQFRRRGKLSPDRLAKLEALGV